MKIKIPKKKKKRERFGCCPARPWGWAASAVNVQHLIICVSWTSTSLPIVMAGGWREVGREGECRGGGGGCPPESLLVTLGQAYAWRDWQGWFSSWLQVDIYLNKDPSALQKSHRPCKTFVRDISVNCYVYVCVFKKKKKNTYLMRYMAPFHDSVGDSMKIREGWVQKKQAMHFFFFFSLNNFLFKWLFSFLIDMWCSIYIIRLCSQHAYPRLKLSTDSLVQYLAVLC